MKLPIKLKIGILLWTALAPMASGVEPWEGRYIWTNDNEGSSPATISKHVSLQLSVGEDGKVIVSCEVLWKPGMDADFGAIVESSALVDRTLEDGTVAIVIPFSFEDSNENKGTGEIEVNGSSATIKIVNAEVTFPESARQYGTYQLRKVL